MGRKLSILVVALVMTVPPATAQESAPSAKAVLERTKSTQATYSNYIWTKVFIPGEPVVEILTAEFHSGHRHRVEAPSEVIVADCEAKTGTHFSANSGKIVEGPSVAAEACGIDTNPAMIAVEFVSLVSTEFGKAQRIRVTDATYIREYDVSETGALLRATWTENRPGGALIINQETVQLDATIPDEGMFSRESLSRSYLPKIAE